MQEARVTHCFCGCGARVKHPRLVITNANGWELSDELAEWAKMQNFASGANLDLSGGDLADNIARGQELWRSLRDAIHSGERVDANDEKTAVVWRKHAGKARRRLRRQLQRDALPDPFDMPDLSPPEDLTAWIDRGQSPQWATKDRAC